MEIMSYAAILSMTLSSWIFLVKLFVGGEGSRITPSIPLEYSSSSTTAKLLFALGGSRWEIRSHRAMGGRGASDAKQDNTTVMPGLSAVFGRNDGFGSGGNAEATTRRNVRWPAPGS